VDHKSLSVRSEVHFKWLCILSLPFISPEWHRLLMAPGLGSASRGSSQRHRASDGLELLSWPDICCWNITTQDHTQNVLGSSFYRICRPQMVHWWWIFFPTLKCSWALPDSDTKTHVYPESLWTPKMEKLNRLWYLL